MRRIADMIECENCGYEYDYEEHGSCPECGDDNEDLMKEIEDDE